VAPETHHLRGIFADADAMRAVFPGVAPGYEATDVL
jgi:hypothetical protein